MREECKNFQSRTYKSGEVARFCILGKAPDQPWSCPENCDAYSPRFADVGWSHGTLVDAPVQKPPPGDSADRREVLDSAAAIIDAVAPDMFAERQAELDLRARGRGKRKGKFWRK
jgi:hypothetical protein